MLCAKYTNPICSFWCSEHILQMTTNRTNNLYLHNFPVIKTLLVPAWILRRATNLAVALVGHDMSTFGSVDTQRNQADTMMQL